jgi:hypothetical protein
MGTFTDFLFGSPVGGTTTMGGVAGADMMGGVAGVNPQNTTNSWYISNNAFQPSGYSMTLEQMIAMRLHIKEGHAMPFEFLRAHRTTDRVYVFIVDKEQAVTLEDDHGLFPSDALITKLRLMIG